VQRRLIDEARLIGSGTARRCPIRVCSCEASDRKIERRCDTVGERSAAPRLNAWPSRPGDRPARRISMTTVSEVARVRKTSSSDALREGPA